MKILYITSLHKWKIFGVPRAYYEALCQDGHDVKLIAFSKQRPHSGAIFIEAKTGGYDQVWIVYSGRILTAIHSKKLKKLGIKIIGFNFTQKKSLHLINDFNLFCCTTDNIPGTLFLPPAYFSKFHCIKSKNRIIDVAHLGPLRGHRKVWAIRLKAKGIDIKLILGKKGDEYPEALNKIKIGLCFDSKAKAFTIPSRPIEMAACGILCIVPIRTDTAKMFEYGKEIIGYHSLDDLVLKIKYYLKRPKERRKIIHKCLERCKRDHTSLLRVKKVLKELEDADKGLLANNA